MQFCWLVKLACKRDRRAMADDKRITPLRGLKQLLSGMEAAVRLIDENRNRDMRKVMLGLLERDLEQTSLEIKELAAQLNECRRKHRGLQADAKRIRKRDGTPIDPDATSPLWEFGISPGVADRLAEAGIATREQLIAMKFEQLVALPRIGRGTALKLMRLAKRLSEQKAEEQRRSASAGGKSRSS